MLAANKLMFILGVFVVVGGLWFVVRQNVSEISRQKNRQIEAHDKEKVGSFTNTIPFVYRFFFVKKTKNVHIHFTIIVV